MSVPAIPFAAAVLAGGRSTRMGCDKAGLPWQGQSLLAHQLATLRTLQPAEIHVSGRPGVSYDAGSVPILADDTPGQGPMGGIATLLRRTRHKHLLVLAVDMPRMTADVLQGLLESCPADGGVVPAHDTGWEPLAAIYPQRILPLLEAHLAARTYGLQKMLADACREGLMRTVRISPAQRPAFTNINRPQEYPTKTTG